ncbi:MAG: class I tRNA ligase family protein [Opitutales bacterium]
MPQELAKAYEPQDVEAKWYATWEAAGCFRGKLPGSNDQCLMTDDQEGVSGHRSLDIGHSQSHAIVIPPPNVTGVLHMGHILNNTMQDILTRRARQEGKAAVWVPGTDHAGIATQSRVEKALREEGLTKWDLGRDKFVERAKEWRDQHGGIILQQLKKLGCSCDWSRTVHTLDTSAEKAHVTPGPDNAGVDYYRAVLTAFVELFHKGHIYRGKRMVNWCPKTQTALSDEEVIMKPTKGFLFKMKYAIAERPGEFIEISTTRPETLMGDVAVAFHPDDERYQQLKGLHAVRPFPRAEIPFITDEHVEREFGTGMLKVTPAHDRADYDIYLRHKAFLDEKFNGGAVIDCLTPDGKINCPDVPELHGKDRFEARKLAGEMLEQLGQLVDKEKYENNVGFSERADVPIEPRLSDQWWLRYPKVAEAKEAVASGKIKFYPERWTKTYQHWLENIQDWCISRQLWWGHRIPVWYRKGIDRSKLTADDFRNAARFNSGIRGNPKVYVDIEPPLVGQWGEWEQEEDVLDTWASSWLWPFGVFGWGSNLDGATAKIIKTVKGIPVGTIGILKTSAFWPNAEIPDAGYAWFKSRCGKWNEIIPINPLDNITLLAVPEPSAFVQERRRKEREESRKKESFVESNDVFVKSNGPSVELDEGAVNADAASAKFPGHSVKDCEASSDPTNESVGGIKGFEEGAVTWEELVEVFREGNLDFVYKIRLKDGKPPTYGCHKDGDVLEIVEIGGGKYFAVADSPNSRCSSIWSEDYENQVFREPFREDALSAPPRLQKVREKQFGKLRDRSLNELAFWYPTEVLCTGPDIIFFWVARMIMAGLEFMGDVPFKYVVFNGIIRDAQGRKMSKSLGNSPDPLDLIDKFGADGLRLGMLMIAPKGADILFSEDRVQLGRNFCNKLWNACRFRLMQEAGHGPAPSILPDREGAEPPTASPPPTPAGGEGTATKSLFRILLSLKPAQFDADDHAILAKLITTLEETEAAYRAFEFNRLTDSIYKFFWTDYCDWYVEVSKSKLRSEEQRDGCIAILDLCLRSVLQMLHPVTPFITEELWQKMGYAVEAASSRLSRSVQNKRQDGASTFIQDAGLLTADKLRKEFDAMGLTLDAEAIREVEQLQDFVVKARALKAQYSLAAKNDVTFYVVADAADRTVLDSHAEKLKRLAGAGAIEARDSVANMPSELTALGNLYLDLAGSVDVEAEKKKLQKQIDGLDKAITGAEMKLANEKFTGSAPAEVVEGVKQTLADNRAKREELEKLMSGLS